MKLLDPYFGEAEIITPIEDPCQFFPSWRSQLAGFLFNVNIRREEDFDCLAKFGYCMVGIDDEVELDAQVESDVVAEQKSENKSKGKKKSKSKAKKKQKDKPKNVVKNVPRPVEPFYSHPEFRVYANDQYIRMRVFMMSETPVGNRPEEKYEAYRLAEMWYEEPDHEAAMKKRIEPLLLTGIGTDIIALDLLGQVSYRSAIETYEKLYFNCRDENFNLNASMQLIQRFAMPFGPLKTFIRKWEVLDKDGFVVGDGRPIAKDSDIWKAVAANLGYEALMYMWHWTRVAHGMKGNSLENLLNVSWEVGAAQIFSALYTGNIAHEDLARILSAYTAQAKKITDDRNGRSDSGEDDTTKALMELLYRFSPKMVAFTEADNKARNDEIQGRISAQLAISKTSIKDNGAQIEAEVIDSQISNAIKGG